jgi:hypothetical protein
MTFPGGLEKCIKLKSVKLLWRRLGTVYSEGRLGEFVPVSNPVTQRLTVFSEDASVSKEKYFFFFAGRCLSFDKQHKNNV